MNKPSSGQPSRIIPIALQEASEVRLYARSKKVYPRAISGLFNRWRWAMVFATQLFFYGMPWLEWGGRQALLFDLASRRFYILGLVLYPQDLIYLSGLLVVSALSLFLFTAVAGRLWCGYACPQTVYSEIFLWVERRIEGERSARIRLDGEAFSLEKLVKKWFKHLVWLAIALWTGFTFVGYFTPIRELAMAFLQTRMSGWEVFWVIFYGLATYGNAGFMREQVCKYMCPYARFQGAMFDRDTLIVSYDGQRGEPRAPLAKKPVAAERRAGDCIDCSLCVQVCPTGIDIRQGQQYECIGCGLCVDACNQVMVKVGRLPNLVRYATENGLAQGWDRAGMLRRVARPRVLLYSVVLLALTVGLAVSLAMRMPLKVDVVRDRAALARIVAGGRLENVYSLQIMNATEHEQVLRIGVHGLPGLALASDDVFAVGPAQARWVAVRVQMPAESAQSGSHPIHFDITDAAGSLRVSEKSIFLVPR
ncbi:cytochrome c oxidase accessory protein CcoG [Variovorax dokdonensis]|uniref:Cytochrome c oxidase accessory protein CcoG n=1 Tax=Variovorax dokdonensis TaxID=344883 RepID=A0ABT7NAV9_9BURK|nr:cytochrome c oxidase accessory protein CcoG [Variovorax dokdonensis]MDM0045066.1 cytochrome c oxidase accessory protein CcoG [Variovorax dokdonensis]